MATWRCGCSTPTASGWCRSACSGAGDEASFPISQSLIDEGYVIVDISRERFDDAPTHSGDSLLRGHLPA